MCWNSEGMLICCSFTLTYPTPNHPNTFNWILKLMIFWRIFWNHHSSPPNPIRCSQWPTSRCMLRTTKQTAKDTRSNINNMFVNMYEFAWHIGLYPISKMYTSQQEHDNFPSLLTQTNERMLFFHIHQFTDYTMCARSWTTRSSFNLWTQAIHHVIICFMCASERTSERASESIGNVQFNFIYSVSARSNRTSSNV